jgi:signal-transduction protein with cAMP-binding, CBS, and nucleotidyltransferase domain
MDFDALVLKYPYAQRFIEADATVAADSQRAADARDPHQLFLHDVVGQDALATCDARSTVRDVARALLNADAVAVVDGDERVQGVATAGLVLGWIAEGGDADSRIDGLLPGAPPAVGASASLTDGVLAMAAAGASVLAVTEDGTPGGRLTALVTSADVGRAFGDRPGAILQAIRTAGGTPALRALTHRTRALALQHLTSASSVDWIARFVSLADAAVVTRLIALDGDAPAAAWCVCGTSGRGESLTRHAPDLVVIAARDDDRAALERQYGRICHAIAECGYMARTDTPFDRAFHVASRAEWQGRYEQWLRDPVRTEMYLARPLFDLRRVHGPDALWREIEATVTAAVDPEFLLVLANDCMASLPPLTFFQDAVVDTSGEQTDVFRLEESALRPLVDVGRVFGMAARRVLGTSTHERFAMARTLMPEDELIFREAAETLRILLWQQARIGISQGTTGSELPPSLLSRHDRHVLKSGFRSILRLVEFTANAPWFEAV